MNKTLFPFFAALISSFTQGQLNIRKSGPYYFETKVGINKPPKSNASFLDSQITSVLTIASADCDGFWGYDCVITFNTNLLTTGRQHLLESEAQRPRNTVVTRSFY